MKLRFFIFIFFLNGCSAGVVESSKIHKMSQKSSVEQVLDGFHKAAANADSESYFRCFHDEGIFIGTDKNERWTVSEFKIFAEPYFSKGKGWNYKPLERKVTFSADGATAWFDEKLFNEKYGNTRGSGVLVLVHGEWKLIHYVL